MSDNEITSTPFCNKCGKPVDMTPFCPHCGANQRDKAELDLIAHLAAAAKRTAASYELSVAENMTPGTKRDRITRNYTKATERYNTLARIMAKAGSPIPALEKPDA